MPLTKPTTTCMRAYERSTGATSDRLLSPERHRLGFHTLAVHQHKMVDRASRFRICRIIALSRPHPRSLETATTVTKRVKTRKRGPHDLCAGSSRVSGRPTEKCRFSIRDLLRTGLHSQQCSIELVELTHATRIAVVDQP